MLDRLMGAYASYRFSEVDKDYTPAKAVSASKLYNEGASSLTVLLPPWRGGERAYDVLAKRLVKSGAAVLQYSFHPQILQPDIKRVLESFKHIQSKVTGDLDSLQNRHKYKKITLVASSLGNVSLGLVSQAFPRYDDAVLVVAGSNLARCVWEGSRTQSIRRAFEEQGVTEDELDERWAAIAPKYTAPSFSGKAAHMIVSKTDQIIPAVYQEEMVDALRYAGVNPSVERTRLGHISSIAKYCLLTKE